jgi:hypothetical protein
VSNLELPILQVPPVISDEVVERFMLECGAQSARVAYDHSGHPNLVVVNINGLSGFKWFASHIVMVRHWTFFNRDSVVLTATLLSGAVIVRTRMVGFAQNEHVMRFSGDDHQIRTNTRCEFEMLGQSPAIFKLDLFPGTTSWWNDVETYEVTRSM